MHVNPYLLTIYIYIDKKSRSLSTIDKKLLPYYIIILFIVYLAHLTHP